MICLDTNIVIAMLNERTSPVWGRYEDALADGDTLTIPSIVLFELWYGAKKSGKRDQNAARIARFLSGPISVLAFDPDDAEEAGEVRATIERAGTPIGSYDILIAAQARRRRALLVTANVREFARVPGLRIEDWSAAPHREE